MQRLLTLFLVISVASASCATVGLYRQCDSRWGTQELGTSDKTICAIGCAMTSSAMIAHSFGVTIPSSCVGCGTVVTPGSLDKWLTRNSGYVSGSQIKWDKITELDTTGRLKREEYVTSVSGMSLSRLTSLVNQCKMIITNVKNGGHWVLITGVSSTSGVFTVNDPGYASVSSYPYSEMSKWVVYSACPTPTPSPSPVPPSPTQMPTNPNANPSSSPSLNGNGGNQNSNPNQLLPIPEEVKLGIIVALSVFVGILLIGIVVHKLRRGRKGKGKRGQAYEFFESTDHNDHPSQMRNPLIVSGGGGGDSLPRPGMVQKMMSNYEHEPARYERLR